MSLNDNMYNERVGQVIFTQDESGKTIGVTCKQGKKETSGDIGIIKLWSGPREFQRTMYSVMEVR